VAEVTQIAYNNSNTKYPKVLHVAEKSLKRVNSENAQAWQQRTDKWRQVKQKIGLLQIVTNLIFICSFRAISSTIPPSPKAPL